MADEVIFDEGGMWILVKENADFCRLETTTSASADEQPGKGGLLTFAAAVGLVALHLIGGA